MESAASSLASSAADGSRPPAAWQRATTARTGCGGRARRRDPRLGLLGLGDALAGGQHDLADGGGAGGGARHRQPRGAEHAHGVLRRVVAAAPVFGVGDPLGALVGRVFGEQRVEERRPRGGERIRIDVERFLGVDGRRATRGLRPPRGEGDLGVEALHPRIGSARAEPRRPAAQRGVRRHPRPRVRRAPSGGAEPLSPMTKTPGSSASNLICASFGASQKRKTHATPSRCVWWRTHGSRCRDAGARTVAARTTAAEPAEAEARAHACGRARRRAESLRGFAAAAAAAEGGAAPTASSSRSRTPP